MKNIWKVLSALAAIAGVVYVIAAYGDKIVAWAKKMCPCCGKETCCNQESTPDCAEEAPAVEEPAQAPAEDAEDAPAAEEAAAEEVPVADDAPVAEDTDFEG